MDKPNNKGVNIARTYQSAKLVEYANPLSTAALMNIDLAAEKKVKSVYDPNISVHFINNHRFCTNSSQFIEFYPTIFIK